MRQTAVNPCCLFFAVLLLACCGSGQTSVPIAPQSFRESPILADHVLPAFGGTLLGMDRGEWIGELVFEDEEGELTTLLNDNVRGIVENESGVFVFTGLHHLGVNDGYIYIISRKPEERAYATMLGRLPGAPSRVTRHDDGSASFLVSGYKGEDAYFECYALQGRVVRPSNRCPPP